MSKTICLATVSVVTLYLSVYFVCSFLLDHNNNLAVPFEIFPVLVSILIAGSLSRFLKKQSLRKQDCKKYILCFSLEYLVILIVSLLPVSRTTFLLPQLMSVLFMVPGGIFIIVYVNLFLRRH